MCVCEGRKSGLVVSVLDSRSKGRGFKSHPILDGNDSLEQRCPTNSPLATSCGEWPHLNVANGFVSTLKLV